MMDFYPFLSGAAMFGAWAGGVFFFRFWSKTKDRLFLQFGIAFWFMALERVVLVLIDDPNGEKAAAVYLIRLIAFLIILFAIVDKNKNKDAESQ